MKKKHHGITILKEHYVSLLTFLLAVCLVCYGLSITKENADAEAINTVEQSITNAIMTCYAIEGVYPESFGYLVAQYGLSIDTSRYAVDYQIFAANMMPSVTVLEVTP